MVKLGLCISKPALLLNRIAQRYSRLSRILMEYVDKGDLSELLDSKPLPNDLARHWTAELVTAIQFLH